MGWSSGGLDGLMGDEGAPWLAGLASLVGGDDHG